MRIIPRFISFAVLLLAAQSTWAQNCGCADNSNCPLQFPSNTTTQVCYEFTDAFNNNLASPTQGVCGVYVKFRHGRIGDLELTLTSPSGQQVQLTGTNGNCSTFTPLATWDILFVPCATTCHPDTVNACDYPCVFDGCPSPCPWGSGTYDGTYHPFSGCLEDFTTGPINGQWCLEIANNAQFNGGTILDFEIIPCDDAGILCCDADAGNLPDPNVTACIGEPSLDLDLDPVYGAIVPDPLEYGYTFAVFSNGNLYDLDTIDNFTGYPAGSYTVCGLSYLLLDEAALPVVGTAWTPQLLNDTLTGPAPPFCGDIGLNCVVLNIGEPTPTTVLRDTICDGQTVFFDGQSLGSTGIYADTLASFFGCDSIINLDLTVLPNPTVNLTETICFGDTVWVGTTPYTTTGMFTQNLFTSFGCDSTISLNLTVLPENLVTLNEIICQGQSFTVGTNSYSTSDTYVDTLSSWQGCDSIVTLNLTVVQTSVSIAPPDTLDCVQNSVNLVSNATTSFGNLSYLWSTIGGAFSSPTNFPQAAVYEPGLYTLTVTAAGCSSTASVTVVEDAVFPTAVIASSATLLTCATTNITLNGNGSLPNGLIGWAWSLAGNPLGTTPSIQVAQPGNYQLIVSNLTNQCRDTANLVISQNIQPPVANAGPDMELACTVPSVILNGAASTPNGGISFAWSTGTGNLLPPTDAATAAANQPGTYQLIVADLANACRDTDLVVVTVDTLTPNAIITLPQGNTINCAHDTLTLDGSSSTGSPSVIFQWVGNILSGQGTPIATTISTGDFSLILTDSSNGCADTATVTIGMDFTLPNADAGPDDSLTCTVSSLQVGGSGTSIGPEFTYEWTASPGGAFLSPTNQPTADINASGSYLLTVTDTTNGCTDSDFTIIQYDETPPVANAGPDYTLNCTDTSAVLDASGSTIVPFAEFVWVNSQGDTISNDVQVPVGYPDTFVFIISLAFCTSSDTVVVAEGTVPPVADAGPDQFLDCLSGQAMLNGSGSDNGNGFELLWTTATGHIHSGETTTSPIVDEPGEYVLQVTNSSTGCLSFDTVLVMLDTVACTPVAIAGADGLINCYNDNLNDTLSATGTMGPDFTYAWVAITGQIIDQTNPFAPVVEAGEYIFTVTNNAVGLSAADTVLVAIDTIAPIADAGTNILSLTCPELESCFQLDASGSSTGPQYAYGWEGGLTGSICTPPNQLNAQVLGQDVYTLTVTDILNGCQSEDAVLIQLLDFPAVADAGPDLQIPCGETTAVLDGTNSSISGIIYSYNWTSTGGSILNNGQTLEPEVIPNNGSDVFTLVVVNNLNFCRDTDEVVVFAPVNCNPDCVASVIGQLDCNNATVTLTSTGSSVGADISYQWSSINGSFCSGLNGATACANAAGIYELAVNRTYPSGAVFSTTCQVQVIDNAITPIADAGPDDNLTCVDHSLNLGGASSSGNGITYLWSTINGHFCGNTDGPTACADEPGTYELLVTNTLNGCSTTDLVVVGVDTLHPTAEAGPSDMLTCNSNTVVLMGSGTPAGITYFWTTPNGDICAGENTSNPVVCDAGTYILTVTIPSNGCTDSDVTSVSTDANLPNPDAGPDLFYTCSDTVFTLQATVTGGTILEYQWTTNNGGCFIGPSNVLQPTVACPGTYTLTVTDMATLCSGVSEVTVIDQTTPPNINLANAPLIDCQNLVVSLDASASLPLGQLNFAWVTPNGNIVSGQNSATPLVDTAGIYTVIVTNTQNNCTALASLTVPMDASIPAVNAGLDTTLTCTRNSLTLSGLGSASGQDIVLQWTTNNGNIVDGPNTVFPTVDAPGTYVLTVTDLSSNCVVSDSVLVSMDTLHPTALIDLSQVLTITCANEDVVLVGENSSPIGQLAFHWETLDGQIVSSINTPNATASSAGTYVLTVTELGNNCTGTASIEVFENLTPPPLSFAQAPVLTCDQTSAQLSVLPGTAGFGYQWAGPGTILDPNTPTPTIDNPGVFSVTVTDPSNGCQHDSTLVVTGNFQVPEATATALGKLDCDNLLATISAEGSSTNGVNYLWTTTSGGNITSPMAFSTAVDAAGWYYLLVKRLDNGCVAVDSTQVIASAQPIENALLRLEHPDCLDPEGYVYIDSVIGGQAPYYYSIDGDVFITYPQFSFLDEGQHIITIKDENGCEWTDTLTLLGPGEFLVELGPDITIKQGEALALEAQISIPMTEVDTIWWTNLADSVECPSCLTQPIAPTETTTYRIHVIDTNGCAAMDKITVIVTKELPFYVPTGFSPNGDGTNDRLFLYAGPEIVKVLHFRIFDRWGNLVFYEKDFSPNTPQFGWDGNFEGQPLDPAVFAWMAELVFQDGSTKVYYGDVTLVK